jgi:VIT1/CCC1 family predicted Fe2+/Mn2+ transporter
MNRRLSALSRLRRLAVLDPVDRSSEILFGLIMALTFTTTFEVATAGHADLRTMLIGALGCNLAWGLVDGVMFVVTRSVEKHRFHSRIRAVQAAAPADARRILEQELPEGWDLLLEERDLERLTERARAAALPPAPGVTAEDLRGGLAVLLLVFFSTLPVALPFLLFGDLYRASRVSDAVAIVMLFLIGMRLGHHSGRRPLLVGLTMVAIGMALSAIAIRLGG